MELHPCVSRITHTLMKKTHREDHTYRNIFSPCTGIMNLDVQALGFTPFESGCVGFDCTDDTVCLPELDKFMSVDRLF